MQELDRRSFIRLSASLLCAGALSACGGSAEAPSDKQEQATQTEDSSQVQPGYVTSSGTLVTPYDEGYSSGLHHATIVVRDYGTIKVELDADVAPITVSNFAHLANAGFYTGLTFHRIIKGFMVQGGSANTSSDPDLIVNILGEFSGNGIENSISHDRGVISAARASGNNSGSSGFFIMHADNHTLDGRYAAFGHVTEGLEVVDALAEVPVEDDNGTVATQYQPVIESITMDD